MNPDAEAVLDKVRAGELSYRQAASQLGCSFSWVRYLVDPEQREKKRAHDKDWSARRYATMSQFERNHKLLKTRRLKALKRIKRRAEGRTARGTLPA